LVVVKLISDTTFSVYKKILFLK